MVIDALYAGTLTPLGPRQVPSGIAKQSLAPPWIITRTGLAGDHQGDLKHHGGPEKALHHYPRDHYAAWADEEPALRERLGSPPAFGENISTLGVTEDGICIGDVYRAGEVLLQVSQGRQPCWKLNARFGKPDMALRVQATGRTGWYYRVLREGVIEPGAVLRLSERPRPDWPLTRVIGLLYRKTLDVGELAALSELRELSPSWRDLAARRLAANAVEDWESRLVGEGPGPTA